MTRGTCGTFELLSNDDNIQRMVAVALLSFSTMNRHQILSENEDRSIIISQTSQMDTPQMIEFFAKGVYASQLRSKFGGPVFDDSVFQDPTHALRLERGHSLFVESQFIPLTVPSLQEIEKNVMDKREEREEHMSADDRERWKFLRQHASEFGVNVNPNFVGTEWLEKHQVFRRLLAVSSFRVFANFL